MMRHDLPADQWVKSSYSGGNNGNCIECQLVDIERLAVGDSKDRTRGAFIFSHGSWTNFLNALKVDKL